MICTQTIRLYIVLENESVWAIPIFIPIAIFPVKSNVFSGHRINYNQDLIEGTAILRFPDISVSIEPGLPISNWKLISNIGLIECINCLNSSIVNFESQRIFCSIIVYIYNGVTLSGNLVTEVDWI